MDFCIFYSQIILKLSDGEKEEQVDQDLFEWREAGKIFWLLEGTDEMDEEECRKVVDRIRVFREGIAKHGGVEAAG